MTRKEIAAITDWFQEHVGLAGWTIDVRESCGPDNDALGRQTTDMSTRTCRIWLATDLHKIGVGINGDIKHTLLHELCHGFFDNCDVVGEGDRFEFAINRLASLLLKQYETGIE